MVHWGHGGKTVALLVMAGLALAGCARPTGDFGRAKPSVVHDTLMPTVGAGAAAVRGAPVSLFNLTDDEKLLRDLSWSIVRPPHALDWYGQVLAELQRTRIVGRVDDLAVAPKNYYRILRLERYRSTEARYARVANDALADAEAVKPFYATACRVFAADEERLKAAERMDDLTRFDHANIRNRVEENRNVVAWGWRSLNYRLAAYRYAIERLQIETPSMERVFTVNQAIDVLTWHTEDSEGLARCSDGAMAAADRWSPARAIPGRELWPDDAAVKK